MRGAISNDIVLATNRKIIALPKLVIEAAIPTAIFDAVLLDMSHVGAFACIVEAETVQLRQAGA